MTQGNIELLQTIGAIACVLVPAAEGIYKKDIRRISWIGWALFLLSFYLGFVAIAGHHVQAKDQKEATRIADSTKRAEDSIHQLERKADRDSLLSDFQNALRPQNQEYNPSTGKVSQIKPLISFTTSPDHPNPWMYLSNDTLWYKLYFTNLNGAIAKNMHTYFSAITIHNGNPSISSATNLITKDRIGQESIIPQESDYLKIKQLLLKRGDW